MKVLAESCGLHQHDGNTKTEPGHSLSKGSGNRLANITWLTGFVRLLFSLGIMPSVAGLARGATLLDIRHDMTWRVATQIPGKLRIREDLDTHHCSAHGNYL